MLFLAPWLEGYTQFELAHLVAVSYLECGEPLPFQHAQTPPSKRQKAIIYTKKVFFPRVWCEGTGYNSIQNTVEECIPGFDLLVIMNQIDIHVSFQMILFYAIFLLMLVDICS